MEILTTTFKAPSGVEYTIREQNGQDEEVLTNVGEANRGMSITNFMQAIIMSTSYKAGKLSIAETLNIPLLDRQAILLHSRIFSIGEVLEFKYKWPVENKPEEFEEYEYELDLREYLFENYDRESITPEEVEAKPKAIPLYPTEVKEFLTFNLRSGKKVRFHVANGHTELYLTKLRPVDQSRNTDFIARGLELEVDGKWERVTNFTLFSVKDMREIRKYVNDYDPVNNLTTNIENPKTGENIDIALLLLPDFFFPEEGV